MIRRATSFISAAASLALLSQGALAQDVSTRSLSAQLTATPKPQAPDKGPATPSDEETDMNVAQSMGCVIAGGLGTSVAMASGAENLIGVLAGGAVAPLNQAALYMAVVGVVFSTFCTVGQSVTPLIVHATRGPTGGSSPRAVAKNSCSGPQESSSANDELRALFQRASFSTPVAKQPSADLIDASTPDMFRKKR